tara:strand:+ start:2456 stop:3079 length:624 start_codon:yes stop_codon:yes gene_type:complete
MFPIDSEVVPMNQDKEKDLVEQEQESQEEQYVSKKAYQEVSSDMHKYKQELKEKEAKLNELLAIQEAKEKEALEEQGRWEELYKQSQEKLTTLQSERDQERNKFIDYHKRNSVLQKLGGFKRDEYNKFVNIENIELREDGSIDEDSIASEIDRIRQNYPELIKSNSPTSLPKDAPMQNEVGKKSFDQMSEVERNNLKRSLLTKPQGY